MSAVLEELFKLIERGSNTEKEEKKQLEQIETLAKKVIKEYGTLNILYKKSFSEQTPLEAAVKNGSVAIFQLLVKLGADPFVKPKPDKLSAMDTLSEAVFNRWSRNDRNETLFKWVRVNNQSPLFNWTRLRENASLRDEFIRAGLKTDSQYENEFPIHVAIDSGRLDLVQRVIQASGGVQRAGDISRMSLLSNSIDAVIAGKTNARQVLDFLLKQGASTKTTNLYNMSAIVDALLAQVFSRKASEEVVFEIVKLLLEHGATLSEYNPNSGFNLLMAAVSAGYQTIFNFLLNKADANHLNHQASHEPRCLLFQLFDEHGNNKLFNSFYDKSEQLRILQLLPKLKEKGLQFDQTVDSFVYSKSFDSRSSGYERINVANMSILHFYVARLTMLFEEPLAKIDGHLEIIQALIANGADPHAKATFTYGGQQLVLTAAEYARRIANKIVSGGGIDYDHVGYSVKSYPDEKEFLNRTSYDSKKIQTMRHQKFHQVRNLERVLAGKKPLEYSGLPDVDKLAKLPVRTVGAPVAPLPDQRVEAKLIDARTLQQKKEWQTFKKSIVDHVKAAGSLQEFLERVDQFKKPLQLHFDISTNAKGDIITCGSTLYRFFHYFNPFKFPASWETVRAFGQEQYGIDINTQYMGSNQASI